MPDTSAATTGTYWNTPQVAEHFHTLPPPPYLRDLLEAHPPARPGAIGLDAGCGAGRNLGALTAAGYRAVGIDLHPGMLYMARRAFPDAALYQASVLEIPLEQASCEIVVCHGVLHNLASATEIQRALRELARVATPGAKISLNLFSNSHIDPCLTPAGPADQFTLPNGQKMTLFSPAAIERLIETAGLTLRGTATTYLSPGDPGQRSVWRAVLTHVRSTGTEEVTACSS